MRQINETYGNDFVFVRNHDVTLFLDCKDRKDRSTERQPYPRQHKKQK